MKTLAKTELQFRQTSDSQYVIYRGTENVGTIAFNITAMRWEYNPYGQAVVAVGSLDHCKAEANRDLSPKPEVAIATVTHIADDAKPAYVHRRTSWRVSGSHNEVTVTVQVDDEVYEVLAPVSFARNLVKGSVVELFPDKYTGRPCIRWTRKPVRRQVVAA